MKKRILLIEDDLMIADIYSTVFVKNGGYDVKNFTNGKDVLEWKDKIKREEREIPDLILLDLILPDTDGLDLLNIIQKEEVFNNIPVFVVTNYTSRELENMASKLKIEKYINKAKLLPRELLRMVKERLNG